MPVVNSVVNNDTRYRTEVVISMEQMAHRHISDSWWVVDDVDTESTNCKPIKKEITESTEEYKKVYIRPYTCNKLVDIMPSLTADRTLGGSCTLKATKTFNTTPDKYISHTDEGSFFIGNKDNKIKLGKLLRAILPIDTTDHKIEEYVSKWKSMYNVDTSIVQVSDDIGMVYNLGYGVGGSCMANKDAEYFEIYEDLECKIAYIYDGGELLARAILWDNNIVSMEEGIPFKGIDRCFYSKETYKLTIAKWTKENGYTPIYDKGMALETINNIQDTYDNVPYLDTLKYVTSRYTLSTDNNGYIDCLTCTDGASDEHVISEQQGIWCEDTEEYHDEDEVIWVEGEGAYYHYEDELLYVGSYGYYREDDDRVAPDRANEPSWGLKMNMYYLDDVDEYTSDGDSFVEIEYGRYEGCNILTENAIYLDGEDEWLYVDDTYYTHSDGLLYLEEEVEEDD